MKLYVCANDETLTDGYFLSVGGDLTNQADAIFDAGADVMRDELRVDYEADATFSNWHGGRHTKAGCVIGGRTFGYSAGWVVTHDEDPPKWLRDLCDKAADAMVAKATELGIEQSNNLAKSVIEDVENGEEPVQFIVDNLSRDEVEPELLVKMEDALRLVPALDD